MRTLLSCLTAVLIAASALAQPTIWAYRSYQPYDKADITGPITFPADDPENVTLLADQSKMGHVYAGTYYNYKWYGQVTHYGTQTSIDGLYTIDMKDGSRRFVATSNRALSDMTHDYTTGTTYGIANSAGNLATINLKTGVVTLGAAFTRAADQSQCYMVAIAADLDGTLYGVSTDNNFYSIDKTTAVCTLIGNTGWDVAYTQTMAFDHHNHVLYWVNNGDYLLLTIDITTGRATYVGYTDSLNAFAIPYIHAQQGAPDRVTGRSIEAQGTSVTLSWTNPMVDAQGNPLTAPLEGVKVYRDKALVATVSGTSYTDENVPAGHHAYSLVPFNAQGDGGVDSDDLETHVGANPPGAVGNFTVTQGNYNAVLSWEAPSQGRYGGEFDPASITLYQITRINGATRTNFSIKAPNTTYTDKPGFGTYTYIIKAINDQGDGEEVTSQPVMVKYDNWIVMGDGEVAIDKDVKYKFYDNGATGYYTNEVNSTMTLRPALEGCIVSAKFSQFNLDTFGDTLKVYDGPSTSAPLVGKFTATSVPAQLKDLRATNRDGALTFSFVSDIMVTSTGWLAEVTSTQLLGRDLEAGTLTGSPRPTVGQESVYRVTVTNPTFGDVAGGDYKVNLEDENGVIVATASGTDVTALGSSDVDIAFTPLAEGAHTIKAVITYPGDENTANNASAPLAVNVGPTGSNYVSITKPGDGVYIYPASFYSNESVWESIYFAGEVGVKEGDLTMMSFPVTSTRNYTVLPVTIYVGETTRGDLNAGSIHASELTCVYKGSMPIRTTTTMWEFTLDTPYRYKGGNLVVLMHKEAPGTNSQGVVFGGSYGTSGVDPNRTRAASTYSADEHLDLEADWGWATTGVPDINLLFTGSTSGIAGVKAPQARIIAQGRTITVEGAQGEAVAIYTVDGRMVTRVNRAAKVQTVTVDAPGIYIVRTTSAVARLHVH